MTRCKTSNSKTCFREEHKKRILRRFHGAKRLKKCFFQRKLFRQMSHFSKPAIQILTRNISIESQTRCILFKSNSDAK